MSNNSSHFHLRLNTLSPPPPPQQRRSSLTMSIPALESLLTQAPDLGQFRRSLQPMLRMMPSAPLPPSLEADATNFAMAASAAAARRLSLPTAHSSRRSSTRLASSSSTTITTKTTSSRKTTTTSSSSNVTAAESRKRPPTRLLSGATTSTTTSPITSEKKKRSYKNRRVSSASRAKTSSSSSCGDSEKIPATADEGDETESCCICMSVPSAQDLASVSGCSHHFCFGCIQKWSETENSCPLCKLRFVSIHRVKGGKGSSSKSGSGRSSHSKNPKILRVQPRNQRSEAGAALDSLLQSLTAAGGGGANRHPHHQDLGRFLLRSLGTGSSDTNARNLHNNNFNNLIHGDDPFLPGFMNVILRSTTTTTHTLAFQQQMEQFQQQQQQGGTGGRSSETAIEIDSDDDDVEVLQVTGSL